MLAVCPSAPHFVSAHRHGINDREQCVRTNGLGPPLLDPAILADQHGLERFSTVAAGGAAHSVNIEPRQVAEECSDTLPGDAQNQHVALGKAGPHGIEKILLLAIRRITGLCKQHEHAMVPLHGGQVGGSNNGRRCER